MANLRSLQNRGGAEAPPFSHSSSCPRPSGMFGVESDVPKREIAARGTGWNGAPGTPRPGISSAAGMPEVRTLHPGRDLEERCPRRGSSGRLGDRDKVRRSSRRSPSPEPTGFDTYPADDYEPEPAKGHDTTHYVPGDDTETEPRSSLDKRTETRAMEAEQEPEPVILQLDPATIAAAGRCRGRLHRRVRRPK